jgi:superfamily II RNA helicase
MLRAMRFRDLELDRFQEESIRHIEADRSVIVSAPTGAGKTLIAEYAVEHSLREGKGVVYTAPVKALSNQKYRDFGAAYGDRVGILTGDVSINADAPVLIMTTEIFRNTIFDDPERLDRVGHVVFDEIHYLDDVERGTVWEESIVFAPDHVRFVCLSATIPNLDEIAEWMRGIRSEEVGAVEESKRPVPLRHLFYCDGTVYRELNRWPGGRRRKHRSGRQRRPRRRRGAGRHERPESRLLRYIRDHNHLPCLFFAFNRNRCEELASAYRGMRLLSGDERERVLALYEDLIERYEITTGSVVGPMRSLVSHGVAYHHAGLLPSMKEVVERLFTSGLLKLIFTTSTFALGINMPARAVVIDELVSFDGLGFSDMTVRDYYQLAGRAGRRGMDDEGVVYARLDTSSIRKSSVKRIVTGRPEPVTSQLNTCYATLLNLLHLAGEGLYETYDRSFHYFLADEAERRGARKLIDRKLRVLEEMGYTENGALTEKGSFAARLYGYELQAAEFLFSGLLDELDAGDLAVLAMAASLEGRGEQVPLPEERHLIRRASRIVSEIRKVEKSIGIRELTPRLDFSLSGMVRAWVRGEDFETLERMTGLDEGEIVRNLRRTMQLLREIRSAARGRSDLAKRLSSAITAINRDVVDAERQLRVS